MNYIHPYERPNSYIGRTLPRSRAMRAVAGRGRDTDDIEPPRTVHAAFVRSPYAHAKIMKIDTTAAKVAPGVKLADEQTEGSPNVGAGLLEAFGYVGGSMLIVWVL